MTQETPAGPDATDETPFEAALEQLEGIVERLEDGDLELEEALQAFEQGVSLTRHCAAKLDVAERRIEVLVREGREWSTRSFEDDDAEEDEE